MPQHVFFSWQSDTPRPTRKELRGVLSGARDRRVASDAEVDLADREIKIDRDTRNVPGSPPIMETIFSKIDEAAVFLADLTYVAERIGGKKAPNPNVCIEPGYALRALGWRRVIAVMNTAFCDPKAHELPFDLRYARWPIQFELADNANSDARRAARGGLMCDLKAALAAVFGDPQVKATFRADASVEPATFTMSSCFSGFISKSRSC